VKTHAKSYIDNWMFTQTINPQLAAFNKAADELIASTAGLSGIKDAMMLLLCCKVVTAKMQRLEPQAAQKLKLLLPPEDTVLPATIYQDLSDLLLITSALLEQPVWGQATQANRTKALQRINEVKHHLLEQEADATRYLGQQVMKWQPKQPHILKTSATIHALHKHGARLKKLYDLVQSHETFHVTHAVVLDAFLDELGLASTLDGFEHWLTHYDHIEHLIRAFHPKRD